METSPGEMELKLFPPSLLFLPLAPVITLFGFFNELKTLAYHLALVDAAAHMSEIATDISIFLPPPFL